MRGFLLARFCCLALGTLHNIRSFITILHYLRSPFSMLGQLEFMAESFCVNFCKFCSEKDNLARIIDPQH